MDIAEDIKKEITREATSPEHPQIHVIDKIAIINGFITGIALYPQLIKALLLKSVGDLSILTFSLIAINSIVWIIYGAHRGTAPLVVASVLNTIAAIGLTAMAFLL